MRVFFRAFSIVFLVNRVLFLVISWFFLVFSWGFLGEKGFLCVLGFSWWFSSIVFFLTDLTAQVVLCLRSLRFQVAIKNFRRIKFHAVLQLHNLHEHTWLLHFPVWSSLPIWQNGLELVNCSWVHRWMDRHSRCSHHFLRFGRWSEWHLEFWGPSCSRQRCWDRSSASRSCVHRSCAVPSGHLICIAMGFSSGHTWPDGTGSCKCCWCEPILGRSIFQSKVGLPRSWGSWVASTAKRFSAVCGLHQCGRLGKFADQDLVHQQSWNCIVQPRDQRSGLRVAGICGHEVFLRSVVHAMFILYWWHARTHTRTHTHTRTI